MSDRQDHEGSQADAIRIKAKLSKALITKVYEASDEEKQTIKAILLDHEISPLERLNHICQVLQITVDEVHPEFKFNFEDQDSAASSLTSILTQWLIANGYIAIQEYGLRKADRANITTDEARRSNFEERYSNSDKIYHRLFIGDSELVTFVIEILNNPDFYEASSSATTPLRKNLLKITEAIRNFVLAKVRERNPDQQISDDQITFHEDSINTFIYRVLNLYSDFITFDQYAGKNINYLPGRIDDFQNCELTPELRMEIKMVLVSMDFTATEKGENILNIIARYRGYDEIELTKAAFDNVSDDLKRIISEKLGIDKEIVGFHFSLNIYKPRNNQSLIGKVYENISLSTIDDRNNLVRQINVLRSQDDTKIARLRRFMEARNIPTEGPDAPRFATRNLDDLLGHLTLMVQLFDFLHGYSEQES